MHAANRSLLTYRRTHDFFVSFYILSNLFTLLLVLSLLVNNFTACNTFATLSLPSMCNVFRHARYSSCSSSSIHKSAPVPSSFHLPCFQQVSSKHADLMINALHVLRLSCRFRAPSASTSTCCCKGRPPLSCAD